MVKASDLRSVFGKVTQHAPIYRHAGEARNQVVKGINTEAMRFAPSLCSNCNNARTQPHDRAWETLSDTLRTMTPRPMRGELLPAEQIFGATVGASMLNVHLYFVKLLGCYAIEYGVPLPISSFAVAILGGYAHPNVYLTFVDVRSNEGKNQVHVGNVQAINANSQTVGATWFYIVGTLGVLVTYSERGRPGSSKKPVWHPEDSPTRIAMC
jgi:hypothetical protein